MTAVKFIFWVSLFLIFYTYIGYGIVLYTLLQFRRLLVGKRPIPAPNEVQMPTVSLVVAAYNEEHDIENKLKNSLALNYPKNKLQILFVTDGSTDSTPRIVERYPEVTHLHRPERMGKMAAVARAMQQVTGEVVIYTDANTVLNPEAAYTIARHFTDAQVGAVAGEKQVLSGEADAAAGSGEGFYWKYENTLKKWDSELYSVVGAAGELFAIRTSLFEHVPPDTIIEDFYMTLRIAERGYRVVYEPDAVAQELPSADTGEELKRKIRIAAGGIQAVSRLTSLLNIFKHSWLSFQYISHRALRWTLTPLCLVLAFLANLALLYTGNPVYQTLFALQVLFYAAAIFGYMLKQRKIKIKAFFVPYYFVMMNYAVFAGFFRLTKGKQSAVWERSKRQVTVG